NLTDLELPGYVSNLLRDLLPQGRVTVDHIARCMAMSRRTLQRRLSDSGTSFQAVLDETRQKMALRYLRDSTLQVTQLSDLLGYADLSAFSRAFSRWFGIPPSQWEQQKAR
ncbi:helix-turn-helix transcriptional regulator, partial [Alcanivorax sp. HI0083]